MCYNKLLKINAPLVIHDKEFDEEINLCDGKEIYVVFKIRDSKVKMGCKEGYDGKTLGSINDAEFLIKELYYRLKLNELSNFSEDLCYSILNQLSSLKCGTEKLHFITDFFDDIAIDSYIKFENQKLSLTTNHYGKNKIVELFHPKKKNSIFRVYKHALKLFFLESYDLLVNKIDGLKEAWLLKEMGYEGGNVYDVLTTAFFNDFTVFERNFDRFKEKINKEFIYKIIYESDSLNWDQSFDSIKKFVNLINRNQLIIDKEKAFQTLWNLGTSKIRLYLWFNDLTSNIDFNEYKQNVWQLEKKDQATFIKKIFFWKSEGKIDFELSDLKQIKVFDIVAFREIKKREPNKNFSNLDFNISLLVHILSSISNSASFKEDIRSKIFEYLIEYVTDSHEFKHLDFFYAKCKGRTRGSMIVTIDPISQKEIINSETQLPEKEFYSYYDENDKPLFHNFCDGQKAIKGIYGYPLEITSSWCAGLPCFDSALVSSDLPSNYINWTIKDFLTVLNISYEPDILAALNGYINKANLLIERLKCHSCNSLMVPLGVSNFTYHIVNNFHCANKSCSEFNKNVYLNHCLNRNCSNLIDSRNSEKCKHEGFGELYGWYICDICYSCCSTEKIGEIIEKKKLHNSVYNGPRVGHDELKKIFCYLCGDKMLLNMELYERQQEIINSLKSDSKKHFVDKAEQNNGFWKFRLNLSRLNSEKQEWVVNQLKNNGFKVNKGNSSHIYFAHLLICIALRCANEECSNEEIFTPFRKEKWKAFKDTHNHLSEAIKNFYDTGDIEILKNILKK